MLKNKTVAVVVPCYNEGKQISMVIETMPKFVDRIIIVDDHSIDDTVKVAKKYQNDIRYNETSLKIKKNIIVKSMYNKADILIQQKNKDEIKYFIKSSILNSQNKNNRIVIIKNEKNGGVGSAISRGYKWAKDNEIECTAVMAGDGQMDPGELKKICMGIVKNKVDYVKGNRLKHPSARYLMPKRRFIGNSILSILTKIASGYWRISDTQTGYTAISLDALKSIDIYKIYKSYGMPNDILVKLNIISAKIQEIPIKPVYNVGEKSKMKILLVIPRVSFLLFNSFFKRIWKKYFIKDFHPLFLLYQIALILFLFWIPYSYKILSALINEKNLSFETLFAFTFLGFFGFQSLLFAMWMDILDNDRLHK